MEDMLRLFLRYNGFHPARRAEGTLTRQNLLAVGLRDLDVRDATADEVTEHYKDQELSDEERAKAQALNHYHATVRGGEDDPRVLVCNRELLMDLVVAFLKG